MTESDAPFLRKAAEEYAAEAHYWGALPFPTTVWTGSTGRVLVRVTSPEPARECRYYEATEVVTAVYPLFGKAPISSTDRFDLTRWPDLDDCDCHTRILKAELPLDVDDRLGLTPVTWVFAMPGVGKSTLKHKVPAVIDADYGNWRRKNGGRRSDMSILSYTRQLMAFMDDVFKTVHKSPFTDQLGHALVLCNELDLVPFVKALGHEVVVTAPTPNSMQQWIEGMRQRRRAIKDRGGAIDDEFYARAEARGSVWADRWKKGAERMGVPFVYSDPWLNEQVFASCREGRRTAPGLYEDIATAVRP